MRGYRLRQFKCSPRAQISRVVSFRSGKDIFVVLTFEVGARSVDGSVYRHNEEYGLKNSTAIICILETALRSSFPSATIINLPCAMTWIFPTLQLCIMLENESVYSSPFSHLVPLYWSNRVIREHIKQTFRICSHPTNSANFAGHVFRYNGVHRSFQCECPQSRAHVQFVCILIRWTPKHPKQYGILVWPHCEVCGIESMPCNRIMCTHTHNFNIETTHRDQRAEKAVVHTVKSQHEFVFTDAWQTCVQTLHNPAHTHKHYR